MSSEVMSRMRDGGAYTGHMKQWEVAAFLKVCTLGDLSSRDFFGLFPFTLNPCADYRKVKREAAPFCFFHADDCPVWIPLKWTNEPDGLIKKTPTTNKQLWVQVFKSSADWEKESEKEPNLEDRCQMNE